MADGIPEPTQPAEVRYPTGPPEPPPVTYAPPAPWPPIPPVAPGAGPAATPAPPASSTSRTALLAGAVGAVVGALVAAGTVIALDDDDTAAPVTPITSDEPAAGLDIRAVLDAVE